MISLFSKKKTWPTIELSEIKKRARLLVIDDSDFPYQSLFERDGYTIEKWPDVTDLPKLESGFYDVVLLDPSLAATSALRKRVSLGGWPTLLHALFYLSHNETWVPHPCAFCKGGPRCC